VLSDHYGRRIPRLISIIFRQRARSSSGQLSEAGGRDWRLPGSGAHNDALGHRSLLFRDPDGNLVNFFTPVSPEAIKKFDR